jgi:hypothetical protein
VTEHRSPLDQVLDLVLYAPVGFVISAGEELPRLIEKGKAQVSGQVGVARLIGRFAVAQGQREAGKVVQQAAQVLADLGVLHTGRAVPPASAGHDPGPRPLSGARLDADDLGEPAAVVEIVSDNGAVSEVFEVVAPPGQDLAIPGYDALSASQVVQRLAGLSAGELEDVRAYELNTRGRRTILNKIAQLQSGQS